MSIPFSDTTTGTGVIQHIERNLQFSKGAITNDSDLFEYFTAEVNITVDEMFGFLFPLGGAWQLDDINHPKYPIISRDIEIGKRDYTFITDEQSNVVLDIWRVVCADSQGVFKDLKPVDQQTRTNNQMDTNGLIDGRNVQGTPTQYDKTANGIFLDLIPNYNSEKGLKVFINREATRFTVTDTDKKLGFAHLFHEYLAIRPSHEWAWRKGHSNENALDKKRTEMIEAIKKYYGQREKDVKGRLQANVENSY